eukprot:scaffold288067_cov15-Tisochrysis_lutea.AAC.2
MRHLHPLAYPQWSEPVRLQTTKKPMRKEFDLVDAAHWIQGLSFNAAKKAEYWACPSLTSISDSRLQSTRAWVNNYLQAIHH